MSAPIAAIPIDPDDPRHAALLATDPLNWARRATLLVYVRHATPLAARADRRAQGFDDEGDRASAETVRRDAVNLLRHACTNYEELVADVAAHYGRGRRDDVIAVIRNRALRALAHGFPAFADACRTVSRERAPLGLPGDPAASVRRSTVRPHR